MREFDNTFGLLSELVRSCSSTLRSLKLFEKRSMSIENKLKQVVHLLADVVGQDCLEDQVHTDQPARKYSGISSEEQWQESTVQVKEEDRIEGEESEIDMFRLIQLLTREIIDSEEVVQSISTLKG